MKVGRIGIGGGLVGLALCGCEEPPDILPVAPPGAYIPEEYPRCRACSGPGEAAPTANKPTSDQSKVAGMKPAPPTAKGEIKTTAGGVKYETLKEGTGPELKPGQKAVVNYEGKLENGDGVRYNSGIAAAYAQ